MCPAETLERGRLEGFDKAVVRAHDSQTLSRTIVYLKRPLITAAFDATVVHADLTGEIQGDVEALAKFLETSQGVPQFDLEFGVHQFLECVLGGKPSSESIAFSCRALVEVDELKSEPHTPYV